MSNSDGIYEYRKGEYDPKDYGRYYSYIIGCEEFSDLTAEQIDTFAILMEIAYREGREYDYGGKNS